MKPWQGPTGTHGGQFWQPRDAVHWYIGFEQQNDLFVTWRFSAPKEMYTNSATHADCSLRLNYRRQKKTIASNPEQQGWLACRRERTLHLVSAKCIWWSELMPRCTKKCSVPRRGADCAETAVNVQKIWWTVQGRLCRMSPKHAWRISKLKSPQYRKSRVTICACPFLKALTVN